MYMNLIPSFSPSAVTIGFEQTTYTVFEGIDVTVCARLLNGMLNVNRTVVVTLTTDDVLSSGGMLCE